MDRRFPLPGGRPNTFIHVWGWVMNRRGENGDVPFRTGRFFTIGHLWYVATREDRDLGPFPTRDRARAVLAEHLARQSVSEVEEDDDSPVTGSDISGPMITEFRYFVEREQQIGHTAAMDWAAERYQRIELESMPADEKRERLAALGLILEQF
jgi:hypothetical protein